MQSVNCWDNACAVATWAHPHVHADSPPEEPDETEMFETRGSGSRSSAANAGPLRLRLMRPKLDDQNLHCGDGDGDGDDPAHFGGIQ